MIRKSVVLAVFLATLPMATSNAADLRIIREYRAHGDGYAARIWPQSCFLMPDVVVAVNALGPYCSSPRGYRRYPRF